ncbi:DUF2218 domain-containing protein [Marinagarivorans algicola]|uniref:DUF2218 domain-containing protein n=1 Tax=Marinagarivorans algicola TaxID=1513270 RepID=UPI0006B5389B|nr:DUF2218 domain-containing protein [Marinagarivorans algicola]
MMNYQKINQATAYVSSEKSGFLMAKLSRHFSHKIDVQYTEKATVMTFSIGVCKIFIEKNLLRIECASPSVDELKELMDVIKSHFDRFASKEGVTVTWS